MSEAQTTTRPNRKRRRRQNPAIAEAARKEWVAAHPDTTPHPLPPRPHTQPKEADRTPPWWCVKRLGPHGVSHLAVFRHPVRESAEREAQWLAEQIPNGVFVVLEAVSVHCTGNPEVTLGKARKPAGDQ